MTDNPDHFELRFHGRVLEHLGIQMYQSPVNALAELVANAWDADAETVKIYIPDEISGDAEIRIEDDGSGMTRDNCQNHYLHVGCNRRGDNPDARSSKYDRPILGRKGIGKFAGFGIAEIIRVETISEETGEKTVFALNLNDLMGEEYIGIGKKQIPILDYEPPNEERKRHKGTKIILKDLTLKRKIRADFPKSMARRFLLLQRQSDFAVLVNDVPLPEALSLERNIQFSFPRDYENGEMPDSLIEVDQETGWGKERLSNDKEIHWRFMFQEETLNEEELRGVTVFAKGKLVQAPFLFHLTGGLGGQHGVEYLTGQVEADYLDLLGDDLTATERQRINWDHEEAEVLLKWGQERVKQVLRIWHARRGEKRRKEIEDKIAGFSTRLEKFHRHEAKTVRKALAKLGGIPTLSDDQFQELGAAVLQAWEQGRLRDLIDNMANTEELSEQALINILVEEDVLSALNIAEAVKTKILAVGGLKKRIENHELENAVRDYIADNPWLISPELQTYKVEKTLRKLLDNAANEVKIPVGKESKRVDLVLAAGSHLIVLEFMRPGLKIDNDHLSRYELYFRTIKINLTANTGGKYDFLTGYIIADALENDAVTVDKIRSMETENMLAMDWATLFSRALSTWEEFLEALATREPKDDRIQTLLEDRT